MYLYILEYTIYKEHESKVRGHRAESQIFQHVRDTDHTIDWNAKVIAKCSNARS